MCTCVRVRVRVHEVTHTCLCMLCKCLRKHKPNSTRHKDKLLLNMGSVCAKHENWRTKFDLHTSKELGQCLLMFYIFLFDVITVVIRFRTVVGGAIAPLDCTHPTQIKKTRSGSQHANELWLKCRVMFGKNRAKTPHHRL